MALDGSQGRGDRLEGELDGLRSGPVAQVDRRIPWHPAIVEEVRAPAPQDIEVSRPSKPSAGSGRRSGSLQTRSNPAHPGATH